MASVKLPYSPEFRPQLRNGSGEAVIDLAEMTGGKELSVVREVWNELKQSNVSYPAAGSLLLLAVVLFLIEILDRRTGSLFNRLPATDKSIIREVKAVTKNQLLVRNRKKPS